MRMPKLREGGEAMSMLGSQADRLRLAADVISERGVTSGDLAIIEIGLREAADTIESLRDRLQELQGVSGESNYTRLFGTLERAARTLYVSTFECRCCVIRDECGYNLDKCVMNDRDALLEWLRGEV